jgi:hypothetical protein
MLIRGPHCSRYTWFGYEGGLRLRKTRPETNKEFDAEKAPEKLTVTASEDKDPEYTEKGHSQEKERRDDQSEESAATK